MMADGPLFLLRKPPGLHDSTASAEPRVLAVPSPRGYMQRARSPDVLPFRGYEFRMLVLRSLHGPKFASRVPHLSRVTFLLEACDPWLVGGGLNKAGERAAPMA
jgi:hypothetical protein